MNYRIIATKIDALPEEEKMNGDSDRLLIRLFSQFSYISQMCNIGDNYKDGDISSESIDIRKSGRNLVDNFLMNNPVMHC